jgi:hypothetical protein
MNSNLQMKRRIVMTLMYAIEGTDSSDAPDRIEEQSVASAAYEFTEPLASARAAAECLVQIIRGYGRTLSLAEQHEFWKEVLRRLDDNLP